MKSINPYDELGRILSSGGESGAIARVAKGQPIPIVLAYIKDRYTRLPDEDAAILLELAEDAVNAGAMLGPSTGESLDPYQAAPRNPVLGGYDEMGIRYKVTAISSTFDEKTGLFQDIRHVLTMGAPMNYDELLKEINKAVDDLEKDYPLKFRKLAQMQDPTVTVLIESIQARY